MILMKWISPFNQLLLLAFQLLTSQTGKNIINLEELTRFFVYLSVSSGYAPEGPLVALKMFFFCSSLNDNYLCCFQVSTIPSNVALKSTNIYFFRFFCDFSWEGGGTLPQNSYKPSRDL